MRAWRLHDSEGRGGHHTNIRIVAWRWLEPERHLRVVYLGWLILDQVVLAERAHCVELFMGMSDRQLGEREFWPIWDGYLVSLNGSRLLLIHN